MRAAVLLSKGPPSALNLVDDYPKPQLGPQHVLLRIKAIAIGRSDLMTRQGFTAGPKITPPKIIGSECVGVVEDVSPDLKRHADDSIVERRSGPEGAKYKVGDVVIALMGGMGRFFDGCYAEYASLPASCLSPPLGSFSPSISASSPSSLFALLAAIPGSFLPAYGVIVASLHLGPDDSLLIHGGSSALGMAAASLAKHLYGVQKVVGTTRNSRKTQKMKVGGFDEVVILSPEQTESLSSVEVADLIKAGGQQKSGFTTQVELIGATHIPVSFACAKPSSGSRVCMAGMLAGAYHFTEPFSPMGIPVGVSLCGYSSSLRDVYHCMQFEHHLSPLSEIVLAAMERKIHADPDKIFHFEDIVKAHEYCESNQMFAQ